MTLCCVVGLWCAVVSLCCVVVLLWGCGVGWGLGVMLVGRMGMETIGPHGELMGWLWSGYGDIAW